MSPTAGEELKIKGKKTLTEMFSIIDDVTVDDLRTSGITLRTGDKILKLEVVSEEVYPLEDEIKEEIRIKLAEKMADVKENLNKRIHDMMNMTRQVKEEAEKKVKEFKKKLANTQAMPDVTYTHAKKGMSVARGNDNTMIWLVRGVYWPKYVVDHSDEYKQIEPRYSKKMMSEVVFMIETKGQTVTKVSTRQPIGLDKFHHYHQRTSQGATDCWGKWKYSNTWRTPDDILKIAKEAEAVLETINVLSIATENPRKLPKKVNLLDHLTNDIVTFGRVDTKASRLGITGGTNNDRQDVWQV